MSTAELAASYAALILADDGVEITVSASTTPRRNAARQEKKKLEVPRKRLLTGITQADKIQTLIKAAGIIDVEPIWSSLFAKVRFRIRQKVTCGKDRLD